MTDANMSMSMLVELLEAENRALLTAVRALLNTQYEVRRELSNTENDACRAIDVVAWRRLILKAELAHPETDAAWVPEALLCDHQKAHLRFRYCNYRGEVAERVVEPMAVWYGATEWHPTPQVFLRARDTESGKDRDFATIDIMEWL